MLQLENDDRWWKVALRVSWPPALLSVVAWLGAQVNYLLFHTLAELFSIVVAGAALAVATTARRYTRDGFVVFVSVAIGWCAALDLLHTLVFKGMHLLEVDNANPATQLWVAARALQALALVIAPFLIGRHLRVGWAHLGFGGSAALMALLVFLGHFPDAYVEGLGLTAFKISSEYAIIALLGLGGALLWLRRGPLTPRVLWGMLAAIAAMMAAEFAFTRYVSVYAQANLVGHLLKIHAYWFVYLALVRNTVHEPFVQLQSEILARERLGREREQAIGQLGERVKELRCLSAVSEWVAMPGLQVPPMLGGVVDLLPPGFVHPAALRVQVESEWGRWGQVMPVGVDGARLSEPLRLDGRDVGRLTVWYDAEAAPPGASFLAEEADLLRDVARRLVDAIERLQAQERLQRLRYLYEMQTAANQLVAQSQSREALEAGLLPLLVAHGTFPMALIAHTRNGRDSRQGMALRLHAGIGAEQLALLERLLDDPGSSLCAVADRVVSGGVHFEPVPRLPKAPADSSPSEMAEWDGYLQAQGIIQRAVMPLHCQDQLLGVVVLYAPGLAAFDQEQIQLLRELARDLAHALDHLAQREQLSETFQQAQMLELRFREVFKSSPVPMQILDLRQRQLSAINDAHRAWLGYSLADISTEDAWFLRVYADDAARQALRAAWEESITQARAGHPVTSPEVTLRCKDGSQRLAQGTMTIAGEEAIIAWTDLTGIRESEKELRESELRFRNMVEQTLTAMYVRRDGRYIYVNPRYCEITGWPAEVLLGKEVLQFTTQDDANLTHIHQAWQELHDGRRQSVSYVAPYRRADGQIIELGLTAKVITWDDGLPATIVMAADITERRRAEAQIAAHVQQLEGAMRGTLQAVSNMIEIRDPYTAGHERRVGLLASAIAKEMGWPPERCQNLELLGLVHDIGKIAVPSEILTKPTRLTALEMELIRIHPQTGYDILKDVPFPYPVAEVILQHHERMDGSGYPRGLKGEEILPEARVLAVADVIESMASHRPYRPAVGLDAALAEVVNNRGQLYAPEVVDAAIRLVRDKGYVLPV